MARDLTGMFAQLNKAILGSNPVGTESFDNLMAMTSQGFGSGVAGAMQGITGQEVDAYSMMTQDAKERQAKQDLAKVDLDTTDGLRAAAQVYSKIGDTEKAMATTQAYRAKMEEEVNTVLQRKHQASLLDMVYNDDKIGPADKQRFYDAINAGIITTEKDLIDTRDYKDVQALEGAYTEKVIIGGKEVPVRYNRYNQPIAVLGEGRKDAALTTLINPANGLEQEALVNKQDPTDVQFLGGRQQPKPEFFIETVGDEFHIFRQDPNSAPVRVDKVSNMTDAEQSMAKARATLDTANISASIQQAINMVNSNDDVGGWQQLAKYLPASDARAFEALINTIKSNVGFDSLKAMKAEGSSLGQVAIIELMMLQSEIANLDTYQDKGSLNKALTKIQNHYNNVNAALTTNNPDDMFRPRLDSQGRPTGEKLYAVDEETVVLITPDGGMQVLKKGQQSE